jgi:peptidoglycan/LPS O-acetylase OafA/YrhL
METPVNAANRFSHVDALRAFAVTLVVLAHAGLERFVPGGSGVTIFFSISGFIITLLLLRERDRTGGFSIRDFYLRRLSKLAPPFLVVILIPTLLYAVAGGEVSLPGVLSQVFFAYNWLVPLSPSVLPGSGVTWSLAIEEQFYIAFALMWLATVRSRHWVMITGVGAAVAVLGATGVRTVLALDFRNSDVIYYGTHTRIDAIALGVLTALLMHYWSRQGDRARLKAGMGSDWVLIGAVVAYLASLVVRDAFFRDTIRYNIQSAATCAVILWGFSSRPSPFRRAVFAVLELRGLQLLGLASYSIYLSHLVVMSGARSRLSSLNAPLREALLVVGGTAVGVAVYYLVEVPVQRATHRRRQGLAASGSAPLKVR